MDWINKFLDWIKLSPKYLIPISLATGFLLFANPEILAKLGLNEKKSNYLGWIGGIFLLSTVLALSHTLIAIFNWIRDKLLDIFSMKRAKKRLHDLTDEEKDLLKRYIGNQTKTQYFDVQDGVVRGLESDFVIYRASDIGALRRWAYNIQPWAWEYLNKHPEALLSQIELEMIYQKISNSKRIRSIS